MQFRQQSQGEKSHAIICFDIWNRMVCHFTRLDFGQRRYMHSAETRMPRKHHMHKAVLPERSLQLQMGSMHEKRMVGWSSYNPPS